MELNQIMKMDPKAAVFGSLMGISNRLEVLGTQFLGEITAKQWFVLICLMAFYQEPPTLTELSKTVGSSRQNVKQLALKLEKKGLLTLSKDPADHRALRVWYTPAWLEYSESYEEKSDKLLLDLFQDFSAEEVKLFLHSLLKFSNRVDSMIQGG